MTTLIIPDDSPITMTLVNLVNLTMMNRKRNPEDQEEP